MNCARGVTGKLGTMVVGLALSACACTTVSGPTGTGTGAGRSPAPTVSDRFGQVRQLILQTAKERGTAPAGDAFTELRFSNGYGPELIWQAETTGDICTASERVLSRGCVPLAEIAKRPTPGIGTFIGASLFEDNWSVMLMADGETVDHLSCQGRDFPVRAGYTVPVDGVPHTVYTVAVPRSLQGRYRVAVQRDGDSAEERVDITPEENYGTVAVQC
ncbi:hypothetical protein ABTY61_39355 [Kitasatospora sp. NPDC096128]|uniref:hypothetical protein n=1 Tax=Kitasatospora sp. NPDC096128 TaxID=3155547 RepID=UPI003330D9B5